MEKDSALYQLMDTRMHSVMNGIVSSDGEYQAILRKSDIYSGELERMDLSKEIRLLIDRYVSEQNALGSRFGMLAYLLWFSDCKAMFLGKCLPTEVKEMNPGLPTEKADRRIWRMMAICGGLSFVVLSGIKFHQNNLRAVIETEWYDAVSNATADHHACAAVCIQSGIIFGKQPLIGGNQPADKRQPELPHVHGR